MYYIVENLVRYLGTDPAVAEARQKQSGEQTPYNMLYIFYTLRTHICNILPL